MDEAQKAVWRDEHGFALPHELSEAKGLTFLFRLALSEGKVPRFNELLEKFPNILFECARCHRLYSEDGSWCSDENYIGERRFSCPNPDHPKDQLPDLDILFNVKEVYGEKKLDAPRGVCYTCGFRADKDMQLQLKCPHDSNLLRFFAVGSERREIIFLYMLLRSDQKYYRSTEFYNGICSIQSADRFLSWLTDNKFLQQKKLAPMSLEQVLGPEHETAEKPASVYWYRLNPAGESYRNSLNSRLEEIVQDLQNYLQQRVGQLKPHITTYRQKGRRVDFGEHIHSALLHEIYKEDHATYKRWLGL